MFSPFTAAPPATYFLHSQEQLENVMMIFVRSVGHYLSASVILHAPVLPRRSLAQKEFSEHFLFLAPANDFVKRKSGKCATFFPSAGHLTTLLAGTWPQFKKIEKHRNFSPPEQAAEAAR